MLIDSSGDASWVTDSAVLGYTAAAARDLDATLKAYLAMANAREPEPLAPRLSQIRCPVRLMVGGARHDGDVGPGKWTCCSAHFSRSCSIRCRPRGTSFKKKSRARCWPALPASRRA